MKVLFYFVFSQTEPRRSRLLVTHTFSFLLTKVDSESVFGTADTDICFILFVIGLVNFLKCDPSSAQPMLVNSESLRC
jgi:hypothetical protein